MQNHADARAAPSSDVREAVAMLRRAAVAGQTALTPAECAGLLASLALAVEAGAPRRPDPDAVDLRIALVDTREFGLVLSAGAGGPDAPLEAASLRAGHAGAHACVELTGAEDFLDAFRGTLAYRRLARAAQRHGREAPDAQLAAVFAALLDLAARLVSASEDGAPVLHRLELDPLRVGERPRVAGIRCELAERGAPRLPRPVHKIDKLVHPASIGLVGVSASGMNFGRIILRNLMGSGYPKAQLCIVRPGETEIDGVRCVESLKALPAKLDLLIVAVAAEAVYALVDEIIDTDAAESVMLIPGGMGETRKSREPAAALAARINAAHARPGGGPVFLGANCLGVVSHPGRYDSWFIPLERLPKPQKKAARNSAMVSQSGAFMITRLSRNPWLDPAYMIAVGNQTDLTHGDLLAFFARRPEIEALGLYLEGFRDLDGLAFVRAVRQAVLAGKQVVVYKAGRTAPGAGGVMGHTASIAGEPDLFDAVVGHAGAIVAPDLDAFDDLFYLAGALGGKAVGGRRLGAISGAGFEAVGMADAIAAGDFSLEMGTLAPDTVRRVEEVLAAKRLDALVEVRNPIDINPGADDEAHMRIVEAFLDDPGIDAVVVGLDPTAPAVRALAQSRLRPGYDLEDPNGTVHLMPPIAQRSAKPLVGIVDGGPLYDAMCAGLMDRGVCVFRNCVRGTRALARYVAARLYASGLRERARRPPSTGGPAIG